MSTPSERAAGRPLRVLLLIHSLGYLRFVDLLVRELLGRGHAVHLLFERQDHEPNEEAWLAELSRSPGFSHAPTSALRNDYWRSFSRFVRRTSDYARYLRPDFRDGGFLLQRAERRAPGYVQWLGRRRVVRSPRGLAVFEGLFRTLDAAIPTSRGAADEIAAARPDLFVITPHLMPGARHSDYVKAARSLGVRTCLHIASWDNLSSKQVIHELPDHVVVWNDIQREEAITLHGVPPASIAITGAQSFDPCFAWKAGDRREFCERFGLDPAQPYLLYVGGSLFPGKLTEAEFSRAWIDELRRDEALRDVGILLRPHPNRVEQWHEAAFRGLDNVTLWPLARGEMPIDERGRADYYDAISHSAAVAGLNTSAMIESAIIGRPVHTILIPEFASSQRGTFHFDYLLNAGGGLLRVAETMPDHIAQLREALAGADTGFEARRRQFLEVFIRPHGLQLPATPIVADTFEEQARLGPVPIARPPLRLLPLRLLLTAVVRFGPRRIQRKLKLVASSARSARGQSGGNA